jgi:iron complex outermembrane receptor protein
VAHSIYSGAWAEKLNPDGHTMALQDYYNVQNWRTHYWVNDLVGSLRTGPVAHTVLIGIDLNREYTESRSDPSRLLCGLTLDINHPDYTFPGSAPCPMPKGGNGPSGTTWLRSDYGGLYLQDQLAIGRRFRLLLGGRYDLALETGNVVSPVTGVSGSPTHDHTFSPRLGATYRIVDSISVYANYTESFLPQPGWAFLKPRAGSGTVPGLNAFSLVPERGTQYEAGAKLATAARRVSGTIALFDIRKRDSTSEDVSNPGASIQLGKERSRGVETDVTVQVAKPVSLTMNYAYTMAVLLQDVTYPAGAIAMGSPRHSGSLWASYESDHGKIRGLGIHAGLVAMTRRFGDFSNTFLLPGFARFDTGAFYKIYRHDHERYRLAVTSENVGNRRYYAGAQGVSSIMPGAPRSFVARVTATF